MVMSAPDFTILVIAALASVAAALAYAMLARGKPGFLAAKALAWSSALGFGSLGVIWGSTNSTYPLGLRMAAAAVLAAIVVAALVWVINDINGQVQKPSDVAGNDRVKIEFKNEDPFVKVETAGVNRRRMIRVRIDNNTDKAISNGRLDVLDLDPPYRNTANWLLKDAISIGPHDYTFIKVVYYDEGASQAKPGTTMRLAVPMSGGVFAESYPNLPLTLHTFFLKFSTLERGLFDQMYCRIYVDDDHILHFERGDLTKSRQTDPDITLTDAYSLLDKAKPFPGFQEPFYHQLLSGEVQARGRFAQSKNACGDFGPEQSIPQDYWVDSIFDWSTITKVTDKGGRESTIPGKGKEKYYKVRFNTAQIKRLSENLAKDRP